MDPNLNKVELLISQSKKLREASKLKHDLELMLSQLTTCNNIGILSRNRKVFSSKVLKTSYKVASSSPTSLPNSPQTLIITVENVSESFVLSSEYWHFSVRMGASTHAVWNLGSSLCPGQADRFCCPLNGLRSNLPLEKVSVFLQFANEFENKLYSKTFPASEGVIDVLHCLDPGRLLPESNLNLDSDLDIDFTRFPQDDPASPPVSFPPITQFFIKLDSSLKRVFVRDILIHDSLHRGFLNDINELADKSDITVFYSHYKIDVSISAKNECVSVKCSNPALLSALKSAILIRLATYPGITVHGLDDGKREKMEALKLKMEAYKCDNNSLVNDDDDAQLDEDVEELMEFYLELRDISESIRFELVHVVD